MIRKSGHRFSEKIILKKSRLRAVARPGLGENRLIKINARRPFWQLIASLVISLWKLSGLDGAMKQRTLRTLALLVVGVVAATGAVAETSPSAHQLRWEQCYRACEASNGSNETGTGGKFRACVARCEDKWLSTVGAQQPGRK
jgi:hypothetical protein